MPELDLAQQGVAAPASSDAADSAPETGSGRRPRAESKRTTRKLSGFYLTAATVSKLKRHVLDRQEAGEKIDASDVVEEALAKLLAG
jgi:hypothetical protein